MVSRLSNRPATSPRLIATIVMVIELIRSPFDDGDREAGTESTREEWIERSPELRRIRGSRHPPGSRVPSSHRRPAVFLPEPETDSVHRSCRSFQPPHRLP